MARAGAAVEEYEWDNVRGGEGAEEFVERMCCNWSSMAMGGGQRKRDCALLRRLRNVNRHCWLKFS